jgi:uncharacterized membrane protein
MTGYLWIKLLHILSATVLFGTGMGTAFFMLKAYRSMNDDAMAVTTRNVVLADWLFTTPAVVVQISTGLWLTDRLGIAFDSVWFITVISLFVFVGACWIPVVWIQIRIRNLIAAGMGRESYTKLMSVWIALGVPAFSSVLILFYLMLSKTGAYG